MGKREEDAQMPNDTGNYDESDTTAEEFDAMWASATPVDTLAHVAVNVPGQSFWLSGSEGLALFANHTNEMDEFTPPTIVADNRTHN